MKNKNKQQKTNQLETDYVRESGKRYTDIPVSIFDKIKIYTFRNKYKNYIAGVKSDRWNSGDHEKGIHNENYETQILIESIILMVENIVDKYEVFSSDKNSKKIKIVYSGFNNRFKRYEFDIKLNNKRTKKDIDNLSEIIDEEINSSEKYNFALSVKSDLRKLYMTSKNNESMYITQSELSGITLNENVFMGIGIDDKNIYEKWFNNNNVHAFIFGATGSGKTTYIKNLIKQLDYKSKFNDVIKEKQIFNKAKIKKKDLWQSLYDYEIWDIVKGKDFKKVDIDNSKKLLERLIELHKYISDINKGELNPDKKKIIIWDEFISSISRIKLDIQDDDNYEKFVALLNSILRESRSAGVHFIFSSQRIQESGELEGIQIMSNINMIICLKVAGNTARYLKQNLKVFIDKDITKLKKGESWYTDINGNEKFCNWLLFDNSKLDTEDLENYKEQVKIESENDEIDYFENISVNFIHKDTED